MSRKMKESGVAYLGEIGSDFDVKPINSLFAIKKDIIGHEPDLVLSITQNGIKPKDIESNEGQIAASYANYQIVNVGDFAMNHMDLITGGVDISKYEGVTSPDYRVFVLKEKEMIDKFFLYVFQSYYKTRTFFGFGQGVANLGRWRLPASNFKNILIPITSVEKQMKIVEVLDKKCSEIDTLIANQQKQIEKLKQYKQSVITEVVTKGLNPDAEMKDSGVEWIGEIPSEWNVHTLKSGFSFGKGLPITKADLVDNGTAVISYGQIHAKYNCFAHTDEKLYRYVPDTFEETHPQCFVSKDDFIFADTSEDVAGSGDFVYIDVDEPIFAGYHTIILKSNKKRNNRFLAYLFMSDMWKKQIQCRVSGVKLFSISKSILGKVSYILPPEEEQGRIADFLESKCKQIDSLIAIKQQKIEKLNQYKKSVIYEYVTGKKEA